MGRILAIDYGIQRTGIAWTDPAQKVAMPLATLSASELWQKLPTFLTQVEKIIIGYPRTLQGEKNALTFAVEAFVAALHQRYPNIPVELVEERFSTQASLRILRQLPPQQRRDKALCDRITASLLLENYLLRRP
ncbi:MAG: Holliday junction resolvase RuvX [Bacteroidia bacterium]|nr:Holliday junction resolvase RuvX [Bacteroidia bacterium]MDW8235921.1 Holliday junction resolvase RuvX [Bacteroidia bacterium]